MDVREYHEFWELEEVEVDGKIAKFFIITFIDIPLELISIDFMCYALYIMDENDGQLWFLIKMEGENKKILEDYLHGNEVLGKVFENGQVMIMKRYYETYEKFQPTEYSPNDFEYPKYNLKLGKK